MASDGSIVIRTEIDDKKAQQELNRLGEKIDNINKKIYQKQQEKMPLVEQAKQLIVELDVAKEKLSAMTSGTQAFSPEEIADQKETVKSLQSQWDSIQSRIEKIDSSIKKDTASVGQMSERAGELSAQLAGVGKSSGVMSDAMAAADMRLVKFINRIKSLAKRVFVFTLITAALRSMRTWLGNVIKTNNEATSAIARLKGALLTLAQPLVNIIVPAFTAFVNVLTRIVSAIASLFSALFGKTISQSKEAAKSLNAETKALKGVGSAADKAAGSLAGFDEINQIATESASAGRAGATEIAPAFDFDTSTVEADLEKLLDWIKLIGAGFLAWKLSDSFLGGLKTFAGLLIAIKGAEEMAAAVWDAWINGVDFQNFMDMIVGAGIVVAGLALAFGKTGAAIGLIVSGILMLITAFKDIVENGLTVENVLLALAGLISTGLGIGLLTGSFSGLIGFIATTALGLAALVLAFQDAEKNGWNLENSLTALAGIIMTGLGISILTGSLLPALIAGILGILFAITTLTGNGEELISSLKQAFSGLIEFITGVFTGDWNRAWTGIQNTFMGVWNSIVKMLESAVNLIIRGINLLIQKLNSFSFTVPDWIPGIGGKSWGPSIKPFQTISLPRLATGAVIPPNREFMAVLGDQKIGNNIEAPEDLIRKIVREESGGGNTELLQAILEAIRDGHIIMVDSAVFGRTAIKSINDANKRAGKQLLLI